MYDRMMNLQMPEEIKVVGFADDFAVVLVIKQIAQAVQIWLKATYQPGCHLLSLQDIRQRQCSSQMQRWERHPEEWRLYHHVSIITGLPANRAGWQFNLQAPPWSCEHKHDQSICYPIKDDAKHGQAKEKWRLLEENIVTSLLLYGTLTWTDATQIREYVCKATVA